MIITRKTIQKTATKIRFKNGSQGIKMQFPFDHDTLDKVRTIPGRKYHPDEKFWTCPYSHTYIETLQKWGFDVSSLVENQNSKIENIDCGRLRVPTLKAELFPFQEENVAFIERCHGRAIVGDEMGLGKTWSAIAWLELHKELRPAVIVVPASLKLMWANQIKNLMSDPNVQVLSGRRDVSNSIHGNIVIVNYEIMANRYDKHEKKEIPNTGWVNYLKLIEPKVLVIDEIHNIMHSSARQTKATMSLGRRCDYVIGLGGTLILNRPMEGYNAIRLIDPSIVPSTKFEYGMEFCAGYHNGYGWSFNGASNLSELNRILSKVMIRHLKTDVLPQLPKKLRSVVPLEITNREEYEGAEQDFIKWVRDNKGPQAAKRASNAETFTRVEVLKQIAVKGKLKASIEWIEEFLSGGKKLVVFVTHRNTADVLYTKFKSMSVKLIGGMSSEAIDDAVNRFQKNDSVKLLVGILDSRGRPAGVGHTLTAASSTAFIEFPWSPGIADQAEDRVSRIGQTADSVNSYYLVAESTIELKIAKILDKKRKVVDAVLDGKKTEEESLLSELLESYYNQ